MRKFKLHSVIIGRLALVAVVGLGLGSPFRLRAAGVFEARAFGAKGDGHTKDTAAIQQAIDACTAAGGGQVVLRPGTYLSGSLTLKSGVRLVIEPGARLLGSTNLADFPHGRLIRASEARDAAIEGGGTIDGQGDTFWEKKKEAWTPKNAWHGTSQFQYQAKRRPGFLHFQRCTNLTVRNILLTNSPSWTLHFERCANVTATGLTLRSPLYGPNTDGIDINSCVNVRVADCDIITGDDGVVLKSTEPGRGHPSRNIVVERCRIWSACNGFKIGTETHDDFSDIAFRDSHVYSAPGNPLDRTLAGVAIESVDGSRLSNIVVSNITMANVKAPLFVRLGHRGGNSERTRQVEPRVPGVIRDVRIENVRATNSMFESSITGIPGFPVQNLTLTNLFLEYEGGGLAEWANLEVPEETVKARYPEAQMFGRLPAYGLYVRHAQGITLSGVHFGLRTVDARPALVCDDVSGVRLQGITMQRASGAQPLLQFARVTDAQIRACRAPEGTAVFLKVIGGEELKPQVVLADNELSKARQTVMFALPGDLK